MVFSIIQKSQLEGAKRIDAEYYQPEYLMLEKKINSLNSKALYEIAIIRSGTTPKERDDNQTEGVILLKTTDIRNDSLSTTGDYYYISDKINNRMKQTKLDSRDVLINIVGATLEVIGRTAFVPNDFPEANITQAMALIRSKDSLYLPEYIFAFLSSKFGRSQANRIARPTGQYNLNLVELGSFKIPKVSLSKQEKIKDIINNSIKQKNKYQESYFEAEKLLLDELKIKKEAFGDKLTFITNLSDIKNAKRMDADFFQPKDEILLSRLGKTERLSNLAKRKNEAFKIVKDQTYKYTEISDVNVSSGEVLFNEVVGSELPANAKIKITGGELIISKVRPTRGAITVIPENWNENHVISGAFSVFDVESPMREYMQVVLKSVIGKLQMERPATGTSYPTITDTDVENILIPILSKPIQEKISKLVRESFESRKKAKELLEEAKQKVEQLIEQGEK